MGVLPIPTKPGHTFFGWRWYDSFFDTNVLVSETCHVPFSDVTVTAHWITTLITWDANGGTVNPVTENRAPTMPMGTLPTPTRPGYTFVGWFDTSDTEGGVQITPEIQVPWLAHGEGRVTYWARWEANDVVDCPNDCGCDQDCTYDNCNCLPAVTTCPDECDCAQDCTYDNCGCDANNIPPQPIQLAAPVNLSISGTMLNWSDVLNNSGYRVYVNGTIAATIFVATFDLASLDLGVGTHTIQVRALGDDIDFLSSAQSSPVDFIIQSQSQPPAPQPPPQPPVSQPPAPPTPQPPTIPGSPLPPSSPSSYTPWEPRNPSLAVQPSQPAAPDVAYIIYEDDAPPRQIPTPVVAMPMPPQAPSAANRLVFTAGSAQFTLGNQIRTSQGTPFIDPATNRMMVPLRTLAEATGETVTWDSYTRSALVHFAGGTLSIFADEMLPDDMGTVLIINDRVFIPLRFVMYAFDATVNWDSANRSAVITMQ